LVNNAGIFGTLQLKPLMQISEDEWDAVFRVNARGVFQATKAVIPSMQRAGGGSIISISSGTVLRGAPMFLHYGVIAGFKSGLQSGKQLQRIAALNGGDFVGRELELLQRIGHLQRGKERLVGAIKKLRVGNEFSKPGDTGRIESDAGQFIVLPGQL